MFDPWNDARSYESEPLDADRIAQRVVKALCIAIAVFCIVWFGGRELLAVVS